MDKSPNRTEIAARVGIVVLARISVLSLPGVMGLAAAPMGPQSHDALTTQVFEGMITCSRCGARHSPRLERPATVCVRVCVHGGANFALVSGDSSYVLNGDMEMLKQFAGERAQVAGTLSGNRIQVRSVTPER